MHFSIHSHPVRPSSVVEDAFFILLYISSFFIKNQVSIVGLFLDLPFDSIDEPVCFMLILFSSHNYSFVIQLEIREVDTSTSQLDRIVLAYILLTCMILSFKLVWYIQP